MLPEASPEVPHGERREPPQHSGTMDSGGMASSPTRGLLHPPPGGHHLWGPAQLPARDGQSLAPLPEGDGVTLFPPLLHAFSLREFFFAAAAFLQLGWLL